MSRSAFEITLYVLGIGFALAFGWLCIPPFMQDPDVLGAFAAGFVNPYSSGYATDAVMCWCVLAAWVVYEARNRGVRHGWVALLLGAAPGVATGFAVYLLLRLKQDKG